MIERSAKTAVVIVFDRNETERLQHSLRRFARRAQHFGHAVHRTLLRLKCDFDKVALSERVSQTEQTPGRGNGLQFGFCASSVFHANRSQNGISQLDSSGAPRGVRLGEVGHK